MAFFDWYVWPAVFAAGLALWMLHYPLRIKTKALAIVSTCVALITLASIELMVHFGHSWWYGLLLGMVLAPVVMATLYMLLFLYVFGPTTVFHAAYWVRGNTSKPEESHT